MRDTWKIYFSRGFKSFMGFYTHWSLHLHLLFTSSRFILITLFNWGKNSGFFTLWDLSLCVFPTLFVFLLHLLHFLFFLLLPFPLPLRLEHPSRHFISVRRSPASSPLHQEFAITMLITNQLLKRSLLLQSLELLAL